MLAAETLYNMERGVRPIVFGSSKKAEEKKSAIGKASAIKAVSFALVLLAFSVHISGVLKNSVTGIVVGSHGPINCDIRFHSSSGMVSLCSTDAAGRFSTRLYGGVYRVVVEKRPGLPKAYQSLSTTPLRVRAKDDLVLKIVY